MIESESIMKAFKVPQLFSKDENFFSTNDHEVGIKFYNHSENVFKVNVLLDQNLLVFVLEGEKVLYHATKKFALKAFEGAFLKKGNYLMSEHTGPKKHYKAILFFFDSQVAIRHSSPKGGTRAKKASLLKLKSNPLLKGFLNSLEHYPGTIHKNDGNLLRLKFAELFHIIQKSNPTLLQQFKEKHRSKQTDLFKLMQTNLTENLTLEQYAFLASCSVSTFKRRFQEQFHQTPRNWITERRLELAGQILLKTNATVNEIGDMVGYENPSHFIKLFRLKFGASPHRYRMSQNQY